jgi:hypothetical protein
MRDDSATTSRQFPWSVLLAAALIVTLGVWIDRLLAMPAGVLHTLIPFSFVVAAGATVATAWRGKAASWQSWAFFIFFTFRMFEPRDGRWVALDLIGLVVVVYTLVTHNKLERHSLTANHRIGEAGNPEPPPPVQVIDHVEHSTPD